MDLEPPAELTPIIDVLSIFNPITIESFFSMLITFVLLILSALISGSEVAYFSLEPQDISELEVSKEKNDGRIIELLSKPKRLLATILISNNFINVAIILISTPLMNTLINLSGMSEMAQFGIQVVAVTFIILLIGEVIPKVYASTYSLSLARFMSAPLSFLNKMLSPLSKPLAASTVFIDKKIKRKGSIFSADELDQALELTYDQAETSSEEKKILKGIVKFGNTEAVQIMTARVDVKAIQVDASFQEVINTILETGYSRIPVYKETLDHVIGVLYIKDLLPYLHTPKENWHELIRSPFFVPENKKIDDLLKEFQEKKIHLAIVVDEYGGASGIVSLEDVIEEIVGDISDEFDDEDILYSKLDDNNFIFEGKTPLMDLYRVLEIEGNEFEQAKGEAETLAGFLLEQSGKILKKGERIDFNNYHFVVEAADKRKIKRVKITIDKELEEKKPDGKNFLTLCLLCLSLLGITSCNDNPIPKNKGYHRISFPDHAYRISTLPCDFNFEYPKYAALGFKDADKEAKCWPDIYFPKFKAKIYLTYQGIESNEQFQSLIKDSHKMTYDHAAKATGIVTSRLDNDTNNVHALMYEVKGNVASNIQFVATDSTTHFLRGSLYFNHVPNADSLEPVVQFLKEDIKQLIKSLKWD